MRCISLLFVIMLAACQKPKVGTDITSGLAVNISFDGGAVDSVSGTAGIVHNATASTDRHGILNKAMLFSSADSSTIDFGALPLASIDSNNQFTVCCWVKCLDSASNLAILSKRGITGPLEYCIDNFFNHNSWVLDNWCSNGSTSVYGTDPLQATAGIAIGQWQHLAYVADGGTLKVYVNGVLQAGIDQHASGFSFSKTSAHLIIGNGGGYGRNFYFTGAIDDLRIYSRALPARAIQYLAGL